MGLKIWGSPVSMFGGSFVMKSADDRRHLYSSIPEDTDIVLTHTPPYGRLDSVWGSEYGAGCFELREAVDRIKPKLHVFGHIHGAYGIEQTEDTVFVNASLLGHGGGIEYPPMMLKMSAK
jgi:Icc-related predicted phosphoesterase